MKKGTIWLLSFLFCFVNTAVYDGEVFAGAAHDRLADWHQHAVGAGGHLGLLAPVQELVLAEHHRIGIADG